METFPYDREDYRKDKQPKNKQLTLFSYINLLILVLLVLHELGKIPTLVLDVIFHALQAPAQKRTSTKAFCWSNQRSNTFSYTFVRGEPDNGGLVLRVRGRHTILLVADALKSSISK